jgi:hypothetical protein
MTRSTRLSGLVGLVLLVAFGAWLAARTLDGRDDRGGLGDEPGVAHVHGLGVNPADGALHVATHYGTFRIPEGGSAERVGGSYQDTMGFTVTGPDTFLGSGHPDVAGMRAGQPGLLGLIESSDAGRTWANQSLSGEVDFHALAYAHGQVYGWDSTSSEFMVSADQRTWDIRSTLPLHGFAVDPADADRVVAVTAGGVQASSDGGRTWSAPFGPRLVVIAWAPRGALWGVDAAGAVQRSDDRGQRWEPVGRLPGEPQALNATSDALWAAAAAHDEPTGIYRSGDDGQTWQLRYRDPG